jgi:hypothetical protein
MLVKRIESILVGHSEVVRIAIISIQHASSSVKCCTARRRFSSSTVYYTR